MMSWLKDKALLLLGLLSAAAGMFALWERGQAKAQEAARAKDAEKVEHAQAQQLVNAFDALTKSQTKENEHVKKVNQQADAGDFGSLGDQ